MNLVVHTAPADSPGAVSIAATGAEITWFQGHCDLRFSIYEIYALYFPIRLVIDRELSSPGSPLLSGAVLIRRWREFSCGHVISSPISVAEVERVTVTLT